MSMLSKERLLRVLKDSADLEDGCAILITRHLKKCIEASSLPEGKRQRLMEIADTLQRDTEEHKQEIIQMIERVRGGEQDEF